MNQSSVRVLLIDDFEPFQRFARWALEQSLRVLAVEAASTQQAVERAEELKPDLILLDAGRHLDGIETARQIQALTPEAKIIVLSDGDSSEVVYAAINLGAWAYVSKAKAGSDLVAAVEAVLLGKYFVSSPENRRIER